MRALCLAALDSARPEATYADCRALHLLQRDDVPTHGMIPAMRRAAFLPLILFASASLAEPTPDDAQAREKALKIAGTDANLKESTEELFKRLSPAILERFAAIAHEPPRRIDYIYVRGPDSKLRGEPLSTRLAFATAAPGPEGDVFPSDHFGLVTDLSAEPQSWG